jgi:hypothetical protein
VYYRTSILRLPSDLAGIGAATFQPHGTGNLVATLGAACTQLELSIIEQFGRWQSRGRSEFFGSYTGEGEQMGATGAALSGLLHKYAHVRCVAFGLGLVLLC